MQVFYEHETFVQVSPDCPAQTAEVPESTRAQTPAHVIQYELLASQPYRFTYEELLFETQVRRLGLTDTERQERGDEVHRELFSKKHPCLRANTLAKRYGWGFHVDRDLRIALVPRGSDAYREFVEGRRGDVELVVAVRSKRA